uniref:LCCL domain-containing protein n=1 Tax=Seriola lalandi dorsalis TaxID=1841481 RepID=A0A3B4WY13_SERLL
MSLSFFLVFILSSLFFPSLSLSIVYLMAVPYPITCVTRGADLMDDAVVVLCPPDCTQWRVSVFGTGIYASVSSVCGAAVHR